MKKLILLSILCILSGSATAQTVKERTRIGKEIRAVLNAQVAAWNRGDIEGFMEGYDKSDGLVFLSGDSITRGWRQTLDRYRRSYDSKEKMGRLLFTDLEIYVYSREVAVVIGSWLLERTGDRPHGKFSLVFRRLKPGWRIVLDHTS